MVPTIDIGPFDGSDLDGSRQVVAEVENACRELGFFLVVGHGVDPEAVRHLYDDARRFFDCPDDEKRAVPPSGAMPGGLAFMKLALESLAGTTGVVAPGDYKESLNYGPLLGGSAWPGRPPGLRTAFESYYREMEALAHRLRRIFCSAIGLPDDHFEPDFVDHLSALRVINYPDQPDALPADQVRAGAHTDYGFLTILRSEASSGGLQVRRRDGEWIEVPALEGAFVINIGDAFMRWTNDDWVSTPHRVVNPPAGLAGTSRRQSIPFFSNPNQHSIISCLDRFCTGTHPPRYEPVSYGDYIILKTRQAVSP